MNLPSSKLKLNFCYVLVFSLVFGLAIFYSPEKVEGTTGVPEIVSFQGRLTNAAGELRDGNFDFKFSIWNQAAISGGTKLWPADPGPGTVTLSVSSGVFNVNIGDTVNGYPDALNYNFQDNDTVYLQVEVYNTGTSSFETLSPRQQINSSGYAINAGSVLGKIPGTGNNNLLLLDGSGNIALAGGIDTGSTIQAGSSNVTLTLSTGFLDADALTLFSGADGVGVAQSASGLERQSDGLTLLQGCGDNQILKWDEIDDDWNCEDDLTGAGSASLDSLTAAIANSAALDSNAFTLNWNWDFTTAAVDSGLNISESSASTNGTQDQQALVKITTLSGSTASPLQITSNSADVGDIFINLASLGDFEIRDAGTAFVTFTDGGVTIISNADINGGAIDGTAIGASSASTGAFTTLSSTGATTLGNNSTTVGVNSNDWDIATDGTMTGIGAITSDGLITTTAGLTVTGAAVSLNTSSNFDVNIATGTSTGDITLGGGTAGQLISINSDDWDISTAGVMTGIGAITSDGAISTTSTLNADGSTTLAALTLDAGSNFAMTSGTGTFSQTHAVTTDATADSMALTLSAGGTGSTGALRGLVISQSDTGTNGVYDSLAALINAKTPETTTNGLLIENTGASGTITNAIQIAETAGTITDGILITGTLGNILNSGSIDISGAGAITGATGVTTTTLSSTGVTTIGNNSATAAIDSSDWNITTVGDMSGIGTIGADGLITGTAGLTITGAAISLNASSNFDVNVATGTSTGDITLGGGTAGQLISINSDDWDISTSGAMTGIGAITSDGAISTTSTLNADGSTTLAALTLDAGSNLTMSSGTGLFAQTHAVTTDATADSHTLTLSAGGSGETGTLRGLVISQSDTGTTGVFDSLAYLVNLKTPETTTNGLFIEQNAASGTLTNAIQIAETAGTITDGILITGTLGNILNSGSIDITGAGAITGATGVTTTTLASTGVTTIGNNSATVAIDSSDWNITTVGDMSGIGTIGADGLITGTAGLTITGAAVSLNISSNFDVNVATGTSTGDITLGGGTAGQLISINSDDWDISTAGVMTGIGAITSDGAISTTSTLNADGSTTLAALTLDAGSNLTMSSGTGLFSQTHAVTTDATADSHTLTLSAGGTGSTGVLRGLVVSQSDTGTNGVFDSLAYFVNLKTPETTTNGLLIEQNAASGTLTNGLHILNTAGTLTSAILIDGTAPGSFILDSPSLDISGAGAITGATGVTTTTLSSTGVTTIGNNSATVAIDSSDWNITTVGDMTGIGAITSDGLITTTAGLTVTGAAVSLNTSSNFDVNIATGTSTGDITLGGGTAGQLISINSDDWDISTAGVMTGIGAITSDGAIDTSSTIQAGSSNVTLTLSTGFIDADALTLATSGGTATTSSGSGLETKSDGLTLIQGCADGQLLEYTDASGWSCGDDNTSAGAGVSTIQENDSTIEGSANTIDFLGADFVVTSSPAGEANVSIDYSNSKITRNDQNEAIVGDWSFSFAAAEALDIASDLATAGTLNVASITGTPSATNGTIRGLAIINASSANANGIDTGLLIDNADDSVAITTGLNFTSSGGGAITTAIDLSATAIGTGLSLGANDITGTTAVINFDNFDVDSSGNITVAAAQGLDTNGAGALLLGKTNATSVDLCNSANCDTINVGNLATTDADTITIGDALDTTAINSTGWNITGAGALTVASCVGCGGPTTKALVTQLDSTSVTPAKVTGLDTTTAAGTYVFKYQIRWRTATATTGIRFDLNHSGTVTSFVWDQCSVDTSATASTAVPDQDEINAAGGVMGCFASRAKGTAGRGVLLSADTVNLDMLTTIEGVMVVTVSGDLQLYMGAELAASGTVSVMPDSSLVLQKIAAGADLAEIYSTNDTTIGPGDVVSLDTSLKAGVKKSEKAYDSKAFGIISTSPSLVMGSLDDPGTDPVLVAFSGRVPVKVNTENGPIKFGDLLTSSSTPGVAMRATKAGQIIGQAMSEFNGDGIGKIMAFIKMDYGNGSKLADIFSGLNQDGTQASVNDVGKLALTQLIEQKEQLSTSVDLSEITTDRLVAGLEVIAPKGIFEGLEVETIGALNDLVTFNSDTFFFGRPYFNSDTAGFALIKQGEQDVKISFEKDYLEQPVVTATISLDDNELDSNVVSILSNNLQYLITNKSTKGFTVRLNHVAPVDIKFSWIALAVKNPKIFSNENVGQVAGQTSDTGTSGQTETNESSPATEPTSQSSETQTESETPSPTDSTSDSQTTESPPQESIEAPAPQPPVVESSPETQAAE